LAAAPPSESIAEEGVRGFLHRPADPNGLGLVLTHGAGGNCRAPLLVAIAEAASAAGFAVLRCDLPFRQRRPTGPPSPSTAAADRDGLRRAAALLRRHAGRGVILGGQSYGGRQASMLAAEDPDVAAALLLLSYPLHPPGKPAQLRTAHLPQLRCPVVFVQGTADPFGSPDELRAATRLPAGPVQLVLVAGAGHDLKRGRFDLSPIRTALQRLAATI
jgi:predicted alpha/beta-hydrolase family hydrolase